MNESLTTVEPKSPIQLWRDALALDVVAGRISKDTAYTYEIGMRRFESWAKGRYAVGGELGADAIKQWLADRL
ncbi:MAG: hypothetical protein ACREA2_14460 [Blastocatellia bacterium]